MLTEVDPHWRFNTSKKISQLTKVVFRLHSNSMDHRDSAVELKERYEDEISDILSDGKSWLEATQKEADSFHPAIESVVLKEFENKFEQTKAQFDTAKKKVLSQTEKLIKNATSQLESIRLQLDQIKQKSADDQQEFTEIANQINQLTEQTSGMMQGNRKKIIDRLIAEANAKYEATLQITQKKEQEMREKYENENENLKKTLESSKISAEDTLNQSIKTISESIEQLSNDNIQLTNLIKQFSDQSEEHKTDVQKVFAIAETLRDKILDNQKKELINFQAQLQKLKADHETEIKNIKDLISTEETSFNQAYNQKKNEYEKYDQICKQKVAEYEELTKKATAEAELKNQQLVKEHNEVLEKYEAAKNQFVDAEHAKSHLVNQKVLDIQKNHQKKLTEIRNEIDKQLNDYLASFEKTIIDHQTDLIQMKTENKSHFTDQQKKLLETNKDDTNELKNVFIEKSRLKNSMELTKFEFKRDFENVENEKNREMTIIQREHEAKMSYLDHCFDFDIKEIDDKLNASFEKEKKQFLINMKFAEERSNIDIKHTIESKKNEMESKMQESLEAELDKNETELSILTQEIEEKTIDRKNIDIRLQNDLADHNAKLTEMQKEVKSLEKNWVEQKQKYLQNWTEKFEKIKNQLTEEEKQNEDMRKFDESKCQQIVDKLKSELQEEEENGKKKLAEITKSIEEEKKNGEGEINRLKGEIAKLTTNRESSVSDLEKKLEELKEERASLIKEENEKKTNEIDSENQKLKDLRKQYSKETCDLKKSLVESSHNHDKEMLDMKIKFEQSRLDFDYLVEEFERKKNHELQIIENKNQYELEILTIELVKLQNESDRVCDESKKNLDSLKSIEKDCNEMIEKESEFYHQKAELENKKKIIEKQKIITELNSKINDFENDKFKVQPRFIDVEEISCLEEILNERIESNEFIDELIKKYESFFIEHELHFTQLKEGKQPPKIQDMPTIVAPIAQTNSKKLKRDKMSSLFSSQRKVSAIKDFNTPSRKNKVIV